MQVVMYTRYAAGILVGGGKPMAITWRQQGKLLLHAVDVGRQTFGSESVTVADLLDDHQAPLFPRLWDARVISIDNYRMLLRGYESHLGKGQLQEWVCEPVQVNGMLVKLPDIRAA